MLTTAEKLADKFVVHETSAEKREEAELQIGQNWNEWLAAIAWFA